MQFTSDLALVQGTLQGEAASVDEFLERMKCVRRMLAYRNRNYGNPLGQEELDDLVQETLVAVWKKLKEYKGTGPLEAWVFRFTFLQIVSRLRELERRPKLVETVPEEGAEDPLPQDDREFALLYESLERLGPPASEIIALKHLQGRKFVEIASELGMPLNTVKTRYYRGLARLRSMLGAHPQDEQQ